MNLFILALFAVPALAVIIWHFAFLIAVNKRFEDKHAASGRSAR
jgi:hypothetical protein